MKLVENYVPYKFTGTFFAEMNSYEVISKEKKKETRYFADFQIYLKFGNVLLICYFWDFKIKFMHILFCELYYFKDW